MRATVNTDQEPYFERGTGNERTAEDLAGLSKITAAMTHSTRRRTVFYATIDVQGTDGKYKYRSERYADQRDALPDHVVVDRFAIQKSRKDQDGERYYVKPHAYIEDWDSLLHRLSTRALATTEAADKGIRMTGCDRR